MNLPNIYIKLDSIDFDLIFDKLMLIDDSYNKKEAYIYPYHLRVMFKKGSNEFKPYSSKIVLIAN